MAGRKAVGPDALPSELLKALAEDSEVPRKSHDRRGAKIRVRQREAFFFFLKKKNSILASRDKYTPGSKKTKSYCDDCAEQRRCATTTVGGCHDQGASPEEGRIERSVAITEAFPRWRTPAMCSSKLSVDASHLAGGTMRIQTAAFKYQHGVVCGQDTCTKMRKKGICSSAYFRTKNMLYSIRVWRINIPITI